MTMRLLFVGIAILLMNASCLVSAQEPVQDSVQDSAVTKANSQEVESQADRDARMAWWKEARFGMFVHWGVYSVVGGQYKGQDLPNSAEWMTPAGRL